MKSRWSLRGFIQHSAEHRRWTICNPFQERSKHARAGHELRVQGVVAVEEEVTACAFGTGGNQRMEVGPSLDRVAAVAVNEDSPRGDRERSREDR
jgi:hypothetical protein